MSIISTVEDDVLTVIAQALPGKLRKIGSLPGTWSAKLLEALLQTAPAVYVAFNGGKFGSSPLCQLDARLDVYIVIKEPSEISRRRGSPTIIGAYDIIEALVPKLHQHTIPGIATLYAKEVTNLFSEVLTQLGGTVYALRFEAPKVSLKGAFSDDSLGLFQTFHLESDIDGDNATDFTNEFDLP